MCGLFCKSFRIISIQLTAINGKRLCAILLAKASVYPLSAVKASVGRFVDDCAKALLMCDTH